MKAVLQIGIPEQTTGRPSEHDEHGLRALIVDNMRLRRFLVPQQLRAQRRLRLPRGWLEADWPGGPRQSASRDRRVP